MLTVDSISFSDKGFANSIKTKNPIKKAHCISNKTFVVIDDSFVKGLKIEEENTWFEQEQTENGILLKIRRVAPIKEGKS